MSNLDPMPWKTAIAEVDKLEYDKKPAVSKQEIIETGQQDRQKESVTVNISDQVVNPSELPRSYRLVRNLLWIENHPVYKQALSEWVNEEKSIESRIERRLKRRADLKAEIFNVFGFYLVFQGVLLTASAQTSYLHCQNVGLPISLSSFTSVGTLLHLRQKFMEMSGLREDTKKENTRLKVVKEKILALKDEGELFRFNKYDLDGKEDLSKKNKKRFIVILAIFLFSAVFIIAHPLILCRPGPAA
ncbi:hypothetical protein M758_2G067700 [Ceratodon purpureus]|nr:hypothetical protein M758_2G067700 [Ceratodon purpureus]